MDYTYLSQIAFVCYFFYVAYLARYGPNKEKLIEFFYVVHDFLRQSDQPADSDSEDDNEKEEPKREEKKPKRFEDKYLEEYKNLPNEELTKEQLDSLKNNIVMENTPLGNVVMFFDNKKETFVFYSDLTMPYRYLEVVGRKYVTTYKCKNLYVDMEEQLKSAEEKKKQKQEPLEDVALESKNPEKKINAANTKKDVFAKFKTYNNSVTKEVVAAPAKNAGNKDITKKDNENALLKDNANKYRYEGKLANFNFLQPVDKKQLDKRLAMSWADFKASINSSNFS
jgi:hypothetical protein